MRKPAAHLGSLAFVALNIRGGISSSIFLASIRRLLIFVRCTLKQLPLRHPLILINCRDLRTSGIILAQRAQR